MENKIGERVSQGERGELATGFNRTAALANSAAVVSGVWGKKRFMTGVDGQAGRQAGVKWNCSCSPRNFYSVSSLSVLLGEREWVWFPSRSTPGCCCCSTDTTNVPSTPHAEHDTSAVLRDWGNTSLNHMPRSRFSVRGRHILCRGPVTGRQLKPELNRS
ncbi:hypothetical protein L209DRAFT_181120 [Thermothelomyces heterothallicus CBS 203.75]